jgi:hypothetical protein
VCSKISHIIMSLIYSIFVIKIFFKLRVKTSLYQTSSPGSMRKFVHVLSFLNRSASITEARNVQGELRDSTVCKNFTTSEI